MPKVNRSDIGTPFASSNSALGLTTLSAWWIYNGILPDRIDPGCPTQNGSHERMHADLSREIHFGTGSSETSHRGYTLPVDAKTGAILCPDPLPR